MYQYNYPIDNYNLYGYETLSQIYQNLIDAMTKSSQTNIKLKAATEQEIRNKFERLKDAENELNDALKNAEIKKQLQIASKGIIDPDKIPDEALSTILEKHSNLLGLTKKYNTKVKNLADILEIINGVIAEKTGNQYGVSVKLNYPTYVPLYPSIYTGY
jgi:DNA repair ATPase RecN